jgi:ABC-type multidrug transport system ATPase subunit
VILSTHIVSDIETIANRVIIFKDHKLLTNDSPAAICETLGGRVYETDESKNIPAGSLTLTQRQDGGKTVTRFAAETDCGNIAQSVNPNLEDVFLYIFRDEVQ